MDIIIYRCLYRSRQDVATYLVAKIVYIRTSGAVHFAGTFPPLAT